MSKSKTESLTLVVCETFAEFSSWLDRMPSLKGHSVLWVRSARMFYVHSGTGAKVEWLPSAKIRSDYADLQAAFKLNDYRA